MASSAPTSAPLCALALDDGTEAVLVLTMALEEALAAGDVADPEEAAAGSWDEASTIVVTGDD